MNVIKYEVNGSLTEIEVTEEVLKAYEQILIEEKRAVWRKKKRKERSLDTMLETGFQIADPKSDTEKIISVQEEKRVLHKALTSLTAEERKLIKKYYFQGLTYEKIAAQSGVQKAAVCKRIKRILAKIKKFFQSNGNF